MIDPNDSLPPLHILAEDTGDYTEYKIYGTPIEGLLVWDRKLYTDERGFYQELSKTEEIAEVLGREIVIKQTSLSFNEASGVLRGLHAEPMDKIITALTGKVFIAIADVRPDSETFGKVVTFTLDMSDHRKQKLSLIVSNGLANSFLTIGDEEVMYLYQTSSAYKTSEGKRSIKWNDPDLAIAWPKEPRIISDLDKENKSLREVFPEKFG